MHLFKYLIDCIPEIYMSHIYVLFSDELYLKKNATQI